MPYGHEALFRQAIYPIKECFNPRCSMNNEYTNVLLDIFPEKRLTLD